MKRFEIVRLGVLLTFSPFAATASSSTERSCLELHASTFKVINYLGRQTPILNVIRDQKLRTLVLENSWAASYGAMLDGFGSALTWTIDSITHSLIGQGHWDSNVGQTEVVFLKDSKRMAINNDGFQMNVQVYIDIFVSPDKRSSVLPLMQKTTAEIRIERRLPEEVKFVFQFQTQPILEGEHVGFYRLRLYPNLLAEVEGEGAAAKRVVTDYPATATEAGINLIAESLIRRLKVNAAITPLQP